MDRSAVVSSGVENCMLVSFIQRERDILKVNVIQIVSQYEEFVLDVKFLYLF